MVLIVARIATNLIHYNKFKYEILFFKLRFFNYGYLKTKNICLHIIKWYWSVIAPPWEQKIELSPQFRTRHTTPFKSKKI